MTSSQLYKWCGAYNRDGEEYKVAKNFLFLRFCVDVTCCCKWSRPDYFFSCMCACCWHRSNVLTCRASKQSFFSPVCRAWNFRKPHSKDLSLSSVALMWNFGDVIQWVDMCGSQVTETVLLKELPTMTAMTHNFHFWLSSRSQLAAGSAVVIPVLSDPIH